METRNDFSKGSVVKNIWSLAVPMTVAQLVNVLYSVVDRVYIGHLPHTSTEALTGIGLALPVITMITAFSNLFGMGGEHRFVRLPGERATENGQRRSWEILLPCCSCRVRH